MSLSFHNKDYLDQVTVEELPSYEDPAYDAEEVEDEDDYEEITQEDCWAVISSFFEEKGLVRQQLDSFDEFVQNNMQELVDENADLILDQADQHTGHANDVTRRYELHFGQIFLSRPTVTEADGSVVPVFPQEARLRNLTYSAPLYIEVQRKFSVGREDTEGQPGDIIWDVELDDTVAEEKQKVWVGKVRLHVFSNTNETVELSRSFPSCSGQLSASSLSSLRKNSMISMSAHTTLEDTSSSTDRKRFLLPRSAWPQTTSMFSQRHSPLPSISWPRFVLLLKKVEKLSVSSR